MPSLATTDTPAIADIPGAAKLTAAQWRETLGTEVYGPDTEGERDAEDQQALRRILGCPGELDGSNGPLLKNGVLR